MATTVMVPSQIAPLAFWEQFQQELEVQVLECNTVAGECLWAIVRTCEPVPRIMVTSRCREGHYIECAFDPDRSVLKCTPGPALDADVLHFEWTGKSLRCDCREFSAGEALRTMLDELVAYVDED